MAAVVTTTNTLNVALGESSLQGVGEEIVWKFDNPQTGLNFQSVANAFSDVFSNCGPCTANGTKLYYIKSAQTVQTVKTVEELV